MALETLKNVKEIGGFSVVDEKERDDFLSKHGNDWNEFDKSRIFFPIHISHDKNMISFRIQAGPIKENGVNGCQVDTMIEAAKMIIEGLNKKFPCRENAVAITKLDEALMWLDKRKKDRVKRGVEGTNEA